MFRTIKVCIAKKTTLINKKQGFNFFNTHTIRAIKKYNGNLWISKISVFAFGIIFLLSALHYKLSAQTTNFKYARPSSAILLAQLKEKNPNFNHPRLYARSADFDTLRNKIAVDPQLKTWFATILKTANKLKDIDTIPPVYPIKKVATPISRSVPNRLYALCLAYQISKDKKYADRAFKEMEAIANWPDWGIKPNFLSVADMMQAFSVGYDWCYQAMNPAQRLLIKNAIMEKGLKRMINEYNTNPNNTFIDRIGNVFGSNNWNPWCNGAASACALVIGDEEPIISGEVLERALVIVENFAATCGPDGGSVEGPGYGNGAMNNYIMWIAAMESALGTSYNYFDVPGIKDYVYFSPYLNGPVKSLNFHDAGTDEKKYLDVAFFMANKLKQASLGNMRKSDIISGNTKAGFFDILWYKPELYGVDTQQLPLDRYFKGKVQTGSMRSSFNDSNALFLAFHAGENDVSHTHLDIGQFNIDAMGLNWAMDLGTDRITYNPDLAGTFERYEIYRLNPGGHNTLLINPSKSFYGQSIPAFNPVIKFITKPSECRAIIDMTKAYQTQANTAKRGYALTNNRSTFIIQDELDLKQPSELWWFMHTRAKILISEDGKTAILSQKGKKMLATLVSPSQAKFINLDAKPLPETAQNVNQTPNIDIYKLAIKISDVQKTTILVELKPINEKENKEYFTLPLVSLKNWK